MCLLRPRPSRTADIVTYVAREESYNTQYFQSKRTNIPTFEENAYVIIVPPAHEDERTNRFETRKDSR